MKCAISLICFTFLIGNINASVNFDSRIVGGKDEDIKNSPFMASIRIKGGHVCGACIISDKHLLTAAHCKTESQEMVEPYIHVTVHTGTSSRTEPGHSHRIAHIIVHPGWRSNLETSFINDLAVVLLADGITFDKTQQKAELPHHNVISGTKAYLTGWGRLSSNSKAVVKATRLQKLEFTLLTYKDCKLPFKLYETQLCALQKKGHGGCDGDSGSPLVANNQVIGIYSYVHGGTCATGIPELCGNVYTQKSFIVPAMNIRKLK